MRKKSIYIYFPNYEEAAKTKIVLDHYQAKFLCKCGDDYYTNSIGEENPHSLTYAISINF